MKKNQATEKLSKTYIALGGKKNFPWDLIVTAILSLLQNCTTKTAKRFGKLFPHALEHMLLNKLKDEGITTDVLVAQAGVKTFNSASVADIEELRN